MQKKLIIKFSWPNATNGTDTAFFTTLITCSFPEEDYIRKRIESRDVGYISNLFPKLKHPPTPQEDNHFFDNLREKIQHAHHIQVAFMSSDGCNMEHCGICDYYDGTRKFCILTGLY